MQIWHHCRHFFLSLQSLAEFRANVCVCCQSERARSLSQNKHRQMVLLHEYIENTRSEVPRAVFLYFYTTLCVVVHTVHEKVVLVKGCEKFVSLWQHLDDNILQQQ